MLKFTTTAKDGSRLVMLGLTEENMKNLLKDKPIIVDLRELGIETDPAVQVAIFGGSSETEMMEPFMKAGMIGPETDVQIDPRSIPDHAPEDIVDTIILHVPAGVADLLTPSNVAEAGPVLQKKLRELAMKQVMAQDMGPNIRKIELLQITWTITNNANDVAEMTPPHDCPSCREGLARAAEELRRDDSRPMAIGRLEYRKHFNAS